VSKSGNNRTAFAILNLAVAISVIFYAASLNREQHQIPGDVVHITVEKGWAGGFRWWNFPAMLLRDSYSNPYAHDILQGPSTEERRYVPYSIRNQSA
jgi:hypothetical protein